MRKQLNAPSSKTDQEALTEPLHVKYRPQAFDEVLGQSEVVRSIESALKAKARPHAWLFTGGPGTGKTTLARILTKEFNVVPANILEIDAAANNGVDVMRDIIGPLRYQGFGDAPNKAVILDEAHMLSKAAWASLLKTVEEPPAHVYFFFCTTESGKVPEAIMTRCMAYTLRPVKYDDIYDLLEMVCDKEPLPVPSKILSMIAQACNGSPRQALVMLAMVQDCEDPEEAARILESPLDNKEVIDLCRALIAGKLDWQTLTKTLKAMPEMPAESIRIVIVNYLASCLMGARNEKETLRILDMLACFDKPYPTSDKLAPLLLSFGRYLYP